MSEIPQLKIRSIEIYDLLTLSPGLKHKNYSLATFEKGHYQNTYVLEHHDLTIRHITISDKLRLENIGGAKGLKSLSFLNCEFQSLEILSEVKCQKLRFKDCKFQDVDFQKPKVGSIEIENSSIESNLSLNNIIETETFILSNTKIIGALTASNKGSIKSIEIYRDCKISGIDFADAEIINFLLVESSEINAIAANKITKLHIRSSKLSDLTILSKVEIMEIEGLEILNKLSIQGSLTSAEIKNLYGAGQIIFRATRIDTFSITQSDTIKLLLADMELLDKFEIRSSSIRELKFDNVSIPSKKIRFYDVFLIDGGRLILNDTKLGETNFINCQFEKGNAIFNHSRIQEIFLVKTDFPRKVIQENGSPDHGSGQLYFGQLQTAYQKQGDNIRANEYQSWEVEAYFHTIPWFILKQLPSTKKKIYLPNQTKISLGLNKISNGFGRNWWRGIVFTIGTGLLFFLFFLYSTLQFSIGLSWNDELFGSFLKFINPLRHFNVKEIFQPELKLNKWSYTWDFMGRIAVTYGCYQTIQAFRRFGKK